MGVSIGEGHATYPMLADQAPVSLGATITGIDDRNVGLLVRTVLHACGRRQFQR